MTRFTDLLFLAIFSIPICILVLFISILVFTFLGRPIFFIQERTGYNGGTFKLIKFRSMLDKSDESGILLPDEERITKFGSFLRSTSLDEIPELWNILVGDMTLVGPRPLLPEYLEFYSKEQFQRHKVLPGLTGLAQISGRNDIDWEERLRLDVEYVHNKSFFLDVKILLATVWVVISRNGVSKSGYITMPKFSKK